MNDSHEEQYGSPDKLKQSFPFKSEAGITSSNMHSFITDSTSKPMTGLYSNRGDHTSQIPSQDVSSFSILDKGLDTPKDFDKQKALQLKMNLKQAMPQVCMRPKGQQQAQIPLGSSTDFIDQTLYFQIRKAKSFCRCIIAMSVILAICSVAYLVYQLAMLITIQKQVEVIGGEVDDEGRQINLHVSYILYIVCLAFGATGNALMCAVGVYGFKTIRSSMQALTKIEILGNNYQHLEVRSKQTRAFIRAAAPTLLAVSLLIVAQVGINFITIEKAQQDYVYSHKSTTYHGDGGIISDSERKTLASLKSGYQNSYAALAVAQIAFFAYYIYQLVEFKDVQSQSENIVLSTTKVVRSKVKEGPADSKGNFTNAKEFN